MTTEYTEHFRLNLPDFRTGPWHDLVNDDFVSIDELLWNLFQGVDTTYWANGQLYKHGTTAIDSVDQSFWICMVDHTSAASGTFAADRAAHPTYWNRVVTGIAPRGEWQNSTNYLPADLVCDSHEHVIAVCKTAHTSNASGSIRDDAANWTYLVDMGATVASADQVTYDNSGSGSPAINLQDSTDDLYARHGTQQALINANTSAINANASAISSQNSLISSNTARISSLETLSSSFIIDAPNDGQVYGRRNLAWYVVSGGGGSGGSPGGLSGDVQYNNGGILGGLSDVQLTGRIIGFTSTLSGAVPASGGGTTKYLRADGTWQVPSVTGNYVLKTGDTMTGKLTANFNAAPPVASTYDSPVHVVGADNQHTSMTIDVYGNAAPILVTRVADGTQASKTAVPANRQLLNLAPNGWNGTDYTLGGGLLMWSGENWSASAKGTYWSFYTVANGTLASMEKVRIHGRGGMSIGTAVVGTDPGVDGGLLTGGDITVKNNAFPSLSLWDTGGKAFRQFSAFNSWWFKNETDNVTILQANNTGMSVNGALYVASPANTGLNVTSADGTTLKGFVYNVGGSILGVGTITNHALHFYSNNVDRGGVDAAGNWGFQGVLTAANGRLWGSGDFNYTPVNKNGDTMAGILTSQATTGSIAANSGSLSFQVMGAGGAGDAAFMTFHRPGAYAFYLGMDTDNKLKIGGWSMGAVSYTIMHSGGGTFTGDVYFQSGQVFSAVQALTDAATISQWNAAIGQKASVAINGNRNMQVVANPQSGATYFLWVGQGTAGSTINWTTSGVGSFDFGAAGAPTLSTTAGRWDLLTFEGFNVGSGVRLRYTGIAKGFT